MRGKRTPWILLPALLVTPCLWGADKPADFEEDPDTGQPAQLDWPEASFENPIKRGLYFRPGEVFSFRAQWGIFRNAGSMTITTRESKDGLIVETDTASRGFIKAFYPMWLKATTVLDTQNWRMTRQEVQGEIRKRPSQTNTRFDYEANVMQYRDQNETRRNSDRRIPYSCPLDYSAGLLQIRAWDLESKGKRHPLLVSSRGKFYFVEMEVIGIEKIATRWGEQKAYVLEPVFTYPESRTFREGGNMQIWISADKQRLPLRFDLKTKVGVASMRLADVKLADEPILAEMPTKPAQQAF